MSWRSTLPKDPDSRLKNPSLRSRVHDYTPQQDFTHAACSRKHSNPPHHHHHPRPHPLASPHPTLTQRRPPPPTMPPPSININLQLGDDASHPRRPPVRDLQLTSKKRTLRSAAAASAVEPAMRSTSRVTPPLPPPHTTELTREKKKTAPRVTVADIK